MRNKRYDPLTHRYPRTLEEAFGNWYDPIELPREPSLLRWWAEFAAACAVVMFCVFVVKVIV
jgi:hypothetical protein